MAIFNTTVKYTSMTVSYEMPSEGSKVMHIHLSFHNDMCVSWLKT